MKTMHGFLMFWVGLYLCLGWGVEAAQARPAIRAGVHGGVDWTEGVVFAIGRGLPPARANGEAQARLMARRAAVIHGYQQLAEITHGVQVTSEMTIRDAMITHVEVRATVTALIKGAQVVEERFEGGMAIVKLAMPMGGKMMQTLMPREQFERLVQQGGGEMSRRPSVGSLLVRGLFYPFLPTEAHAAGLPVFAFESDQEVLTTRKVLDWLDRVGPKVGITTLRENIEAYEKQARFTGVVVDASLVPGFEMATVPFLKTPDGTPVYPNPDTDYAHIVKSRVASYDFDVSDAVRQRRVANQPFVIQALGTYKSKKSDLVISPEDAKRVRRLASLATTLAKARVVIVVAE